MIPLIRKKLADMDKANCESQSLIGQEKGRGVKLTPGSTGKAMKIKVDDCLITDTKRCDCLYFYQKSKSKRHAFLVELKGNNYSHALTQLEATKNHPNYTALIKDIRSCKELEDINRIRLRVIPVKDDDSYDLSNFTKSS